MVRRPWFRSALRCAVATASVHLFHLTKIEIKNPHRNGTDRKQNRTVYIDDYETELFSEENIAENSESSELQHTVIQCIYKLKKPDPEIIIQHYYYGKSLGKIAENLKMTESAVQKRIQRARKNLKKMLEKAGINGV